MSNKTRAERIEDLEKMFVLFDQRIEGMNKRLDVLQTLAEKNAEGQVALVNFTTDLNNS